MDNFYVFLKFESDDDVNSIVKKLKIEHGFNDKCAGMGILNYSLELAVWEKRKERMVVVVDNNEAWSHALLLLIKEEADLHGN